MTVVEAFMENVKDAMIVGNEVFLRGFGSFIIKQRAEKVVRNRHYKIFCVNVKYGIQSGFRILYLIALQNEEDY